MQQPQPQQSREQEQIVSTLNPLSAPFPVPFKMGEKEYYNSKDLQAYKPEFYYGCTSKPRNIIMRKNIPKDAYTYATFEKLSKNWNPTDESCKKAQLLISKQWVDEYYFSATIVGGEKKKTVIKIAQQPVLKPLVHSPRDSNETVEDDGHCENQMSEEENVEENRQHQEIENAPPILHLDDSEKFHDADGNVIEIETRGERDRKKIYFKVKDIGVGFKMPSLSKNIMRHKYVDVENGYKYGLHYKAFKRFPLGETNKQEMTLYLTYKGLLRVLFASQNKNVDKFQDWAEEKLFTIQMGTRDQKVKLGAEVLNTSPRTLKAIFDKHASTFPSIYLMSLGKVRDLRETFGIPADKSDDSTVYKFGFSEDLARRVMELESEYSKLPGVTMQIATFQIIDAKYTSEAESEVRDTRYM